MKQKAFTLVELLVVIAIIGLIAALSVIALGNARSKSRDSKRVSDVKQIQTALELFFSDQGRYPTVAEWNTGSLYSTSSITGTTTYLATIPSAPSNSDGSLCNATTSAYYYSTNSSGDSYTIRTCLGGNTGSLSSGIYIASPSGNSSCGTATVSDADGNVYNTVQIGTQCWLRQNLATTKYNDNSSIPNVTDNAAWAVLSTPAYAWYDNNYATYGTVYGALYNWYTVATGKLCPIGWHVPSHDEWTNLERAVCTSATCATDFPYNNSTNGESGTDEGGKLKEIGNIHWVSNTGATNSSGFTALPGGIRATAGAFSYLNTEGYWWQSTAPSSAWTRYIGRYSDNIWRVIYPKSWGSSIRCLKD